MAVHLGQKAMCTFVFSSLIKATATIRGSCNTIYVKNKELFKDLLEGDINLWELALRQETCGDM